MSRAKPQAAAARKAQVTTDTDAPETEPTAIIGMLSARSADFYPAGELPEELLRHLRTLWSIACNWGEVCTLIEINGAGGAGAAKRFAELLAVGLDEHGLKRAARGEPVRWMVLP